MSMECARLLCAEREFRDFIDLFVCSESARSPQANALTELSCRLYLAFAPFKPPWTIIKMDSRQSLNGGTERTARCPALYSSSIELFAVSFSSKALFRAILERPFEKRLKQSNGARTNLAAGFRSVSGALSVLHSADCGQTASRLRFPINIRG